MLRIAFVLAVTTLGLVRPFARQSPYGPSAADGFEIYGRPIGSQRANPPWSRGAASTDFDYRWPEDYNQARRYGGNRGFAEVGSGQNRGLQTNPARFAGRLSYGDGGVFGPSNVLGGQRPNRGPDYYEQPDISSNNRGQVRPYINYGGFAGGPKDRTGISDLEWVYDLDENHVITRPRAPWVREPFRESQNLLPDFRAQRTTSKRKTSKAPRKKVQSARPPGVQKPVHMRTPTPAQPAPAVKLYPAATVPISDVPPVHFLETMTFTVKENDTPQTSATSRMMATSYGTTLLPLISEVSSLDTTKTPATSRAENAENIPLNIGGEMTSGPDNYTETSSTEPSTDGITMTSSSLTEPAKIATTEANTVNFTHESEIPDNLIEGTPMGTATEFYHTTGDQSEQHVETTSPPGVSSSLSSAVVGQDEYTSNETTPVGVDEPGNGEDQSGNVQGNSETESFAHNGENSETSVQT